MSENSEMPPSPSLAGPALELTPEPSPANGDGEISQNQFAKWTEIYGTQHRQLRRWINLGKEKSDPCPLDHPDLMCAWVERNLKKIRGDLLERIAAAGAKIVKTADLRCSPAESGSASAESEPEKTIGAPVKTPSLDLASVGGVEGESVEFFRKLFSVTKTLLSEAYRDGIESRIGQLHRRLESLGESLRKHESAAEIKAKKHGDLLDRALVLSEISQALELFKLMRENMETRVRSSLAGMNLTEEQIDQACKAVREIREREDDVMRNIGSLKTPSDVQFALAA